MNQQPSMQQPPQQQPTEAPKSNMGMLMVILAIVAVIAIAVWFFYVR